MRRIGMSDTRQMPQSELIDKLTLKEGTAALAKIAQGNFLHYYIWEIQNVCAT